MRKTQFSFLFNSLLFSIAIIMICLFTNSCELPSKEKINIGSANAYATDTASITNEEYVMITAAVNLPLYVNHEQTAFKNWGKQMDVPVSVLGNDEWDVQKIVEIVEQESRPEGVANSEIQKA